MAHPLITRHLGLIAYSDAYQAMQDFTLTRDDGRADELWLCEHHPVFTQGLAGKAEHVLQSNPGIAVVQTNRGGQITYHGPGQVVAYPLLNLQKRGYFVKEYVYKLEEALIRTLAHYGIVGHRLRHAPGVYVRVNDPGKHASLPITDSTQTGAFDGLGKIAALGIKVSRHCTYHGLALNVGMDLQAFSHIFPCGYKNLHAIDMLHCGVQTAVPEVSARLSAQLQLWL